MKQQLLKKIEEKSITVGVVGLGYVGLPLAVEKAKAGFKTIGFDVQDEKVKLVNEGHNYIGDVVDSDLKELVESKMLTATTDFSFVKDVDFVDICANTIGYTSTARYQLCEIFNRGNFKIFNKRNNGCVRIYNIPGNNRRIN